MLDKMNKLLEIVRYISQSAQGRFTSEGDQTQPTAQATHAAVDPTPETEPIGESQSGTRREAEPVDSEGRSPDTQRRAIEPTSSSVPAQHAPEQSLRSLQLLAATKLWSAQEETNRVLSEIGDVLKNVNRALVSMQHAQVQVSLSLDAG